jgi:hypothetical protein
MSKTENPGMVLAPELRNAFVMTLKARFEKNMKRHKGTKWESVVSRLSDGKLWSLSEMEKTGGEPDVIGIDNNSGEYIFCDCSQETPKGRRNVCYDREGQDERERKGIYPGGNAIDMSEEMGCELLNELQYRELQKLEAFDMKTSSWLKTPLEIRKLGGGIFGDRRYNTVFIYHNGAGSFYGVRGFRVTLRV